MSHNRRRGAKATVDLSKKPRKSDAKRRCTLVVLHPKGLMQGRRFEVGPEGTVLGRVQGIVLDFDGVSRTHARIRIEEGEWIVEDLRSTNGTFVNDERVEQRVLVDQDRIRLGGAILMILIGKEIEEHYQEAMHGIVVSDPVTGVPTRRAFVEFLGREVSRATRHHSPVSLVLLDIDHFERIAKEKGALVGDAILREVGHRLQPRIRREDMGARCGPHEFACVLTGTVLTGALAFARALQILVTQEPIDLGEGSVEITLSMGVAELAPEGSVGELLARAGERLLAAKRGGRNRIEG